MLLATHLALAIASSILFGAEEAHQNLVLIHTVELSNSPTDLKYDLKLIYKLTRERFSLYSQSNVIFEAIENYPIC